MSATADLPVLAVIGGTGKEGKGLALRFLKAGYTVILGSRSSEKATAAAQAIREELPGGAPVRGASNLEASQQATVVILTVPHAAHAEILESIKPAMPGKLLIDATVPLQPGKPTRVLMPRTGSAAQEARQILGEASEVTAAFHTISHQHLLRDDPIACEVLVTGTSEAARDEALKLVEAAGMRGWDAGPLENSAVTEGLTSVLIYINKKYGSRNAGIRITGLSQD
jgi:NADPH-dependent F420 reductase